MAKIWTKFEADFEFSSFGTIFHISEPEIDNFSPKVKETAKKEINVEDSETTKITRFLCAEQNEGMLFWLIDIVLCICQFCVSLIIYEPQKLQ